MVTILRGNTHRDVMLLHETYGPVVRIGPNELSYAQPEAWNDIMGFRKIGVEENLKDPTYQNPSMKNIVGANREDHARMRRLMSHGFSASMMIKQQPYIQRHVDLLFQRLQEKSDGGSTALDMTAWYNYTTFDIISELALGESFGCLQTSSLHPWVAMIFGMIKAGKLAQVFRHYPLLMPLMILLVPRDLQRKAKESRQISREMLQKRLQLTETRPDFIQSMSAKVGDMVRLRNS
jgi:cytochrome P450